LLTLTEEAVRNFPRYHKYALGADLRTLAREICSQVRRAAACQGEQRRSRVEGLSDSIDELKLLLQLGKEVRAFHSFAQFEQLVLLSVALGRQAGGWRRRLNNINSDNSG
jgi:hypothetical protein